MKYLLEQPRIHKYSLCNNQERIIYFEKNKLSDDKVSTGPSSSLSIETLQSVLANRFQQTFFINNNLIDQPRSCSTSYLVSSTDENQFNHFCSSLSKRVRTYSLSNHQTMAISASTSFSEEQTNSIDYDNTYFYLEETSRLDDVSSFTTITENIPMELNITQQDTSVYSDTTVFPSHTDEILEARTSAIKQYDINMSSDIQNQNIKTEDDEIISTASDHDCTGLVLAIIKEKESNDEQTLSDYDNVNHYSEQDNKIRSSADIVSLNTSMTSSIQYDHRPMTFTGEQQNKQETKRTNDDDHDYVLVHQQKAIDQLTMMNNRSETGLHDENNDHEEYVQSTRLFDNEEYEGILSDQSQSSDDFRYSSDAARHSCVSDDHNNTSSTLRQEAISITRVRCKRRKTWVHSSTSINNTTKNYLEQNTSISNNQNDRTNAGSSCLNANVTSTTPTILNKTRAVTMLLHNNSTDCNKNKNTNGETPSYDFLRLNHDHRTIKTDESIVSPLSKTNSTPDKDASPTTKKTNNNFYLIHHQSSLIPVKDLLNKNINTNIEIIQMDEQECILEIVNGVLTLVPKDKSTSSATNSDGEKSSEHQKNSIDYQTSENYDSPKREQRSSSVASSICTPPLSEHEQEHDQEHNQEQEIEQELEDELEQEHDELDQEHDEISSSSSSSSRLSSNKEEEEAPEPFILLRNIPSKSPPPSHTEQSVDLLDLFSTPLVPLSNSNNTNDKIPKNLLDDSLSSVSSYENNEDNSNSDLSERKKQSNLPRSSSPIKNQSKSSSPSLSIKDDIPSSPQTIENQTHSNKTTVLTELLQTVKKPSVTDETEAEVDYYPLPKTEPPPVAKPINKVRISEFASLLSGAVHLAQPPAIKKQPTPKTISAIARPPTSPTRSEDQSFSSIPSASSDRDERESYHTVKSNNSEQDQIKKPIDARYNEKLDDRGSIQINTANIKALFEQKISDTNRALAQSTEHLLHVSEARQHHKKVPVSYGSLKRNLQIPQQISNRRNSYQDYSNMNKYTDHSAGTKDVVIEDKQPEPSHQTQHYGSIGRRNNTEQIIRPAADSLITPSDSSTNGYYSESLIAREIRETKEKEDELKRQRKKCGLAADDASALLTITNNIPIKPDNSSSSTNEPVKNSSFLSNLDFFTSKGNHPSHEPISSTPSRRSTIQIQNIVYDSQGTSSNNTPRQSSNNELKQMNNVVSQELNRFNNNGIPIIRTSSTNNLIHRSSSNQNILSTQATTNIIQREIEAIRAKEAELRQSGRIQHTSDEHSDPKKYQEVLSTLPKSQSANILSTGKVRRDNERNYGPMAATSNGFLKPKQMTNSSSNSSIRGKFPSPNPSVPVISSSNKSIDYSKLTLADRLQLEKRECQEREQELRKQRHSITGATLSVNPTVNGDSGNVSQDEHDDDQERYFDKIARLKRTENEKAQVPLIRPTKKSNLSQKWEQMMATKNGTNTTGDDNDDDDD